MMACQVDVVTVDVVDVANSRKVGPFCFQIIYYVCLLLVVVCVSSATSTQTSSTTATVTTAPAPVLGRTVTLASVACSFLTGPLSVSEITVTTSDGFNLARAAVASSSSAYAATPPALTIDGIVDQAYPPLTAPGNFWSASIICAPAAPQVLTITLPWAAAVSNVSPACTGGTAAPHSRSHALHVCCRAADYRVQPWCRLLWFVRPEPARKCDAVAMGQLPCRHNPSLVRNVSRQLAAAHVSLRRGPIQPHGLCSLQRYRDVARSGPAAIPDAVAVADAVTNFKLYCGADH